MKRSKKSRPQRPGWKVGSVQEFLGLSDEESTFIEVKLSLAQNLKKRRLAQGLTQIELASQLGSSQSRVAKMEAADVNVSIDLLVRSMLALGMTRKDLARIIGSNSSTSVA